MARRTKEQARQTRQDILRGALSVFSEKGFSRSTLNDVAKRIGMTRGAVYWHFKDKQELLVKLIEAMHEKETKLLAEKVPVVDSLDDLIAQFLARAELLETNKEFRKYAYFMNMQVEWATEKHVFDQLRDGYMHDVSLGGIEKVLALAQQRGEIRPEIDVEVASDTLVGMFIGMAQRYLCGFALKPLSLSVEPALKRICDSIRA